MEFAETAENKNKKTEIKLLIIFLGIGCVAKLMILLVLAMKMTVLFTQLAIGLYLTDYQRDKWEVTMIDKMLKSPLTFRGYALFRRKYRFRFKVHHSNTFSLPHSDSYQVP